MANVNIQTLLVPAQPRNGRIYQNGTGSNIIAVSGGISIGGGSGSGSGGSTIIIDNNTANYLLAATGNANEISANSAITWSGSTLNVTGYIVATMDITAISDERLKFNVINIESVLDKINKIRVVNYSRNEDNKRHTGVIAQELRDLFPQFVVRNDEYYSVNYQQLATICIKAIQEQQIQIDELKKLLK